MNKSKLSAVTLRALEDAMALVGLHDVKWADQLVPVVQ